MKLTREKGEGLSSENLQEGKSEVLSDEKQLVDAILPGGKSGRVNSRLSPRASTTHSRKKREVRGGRKIFCCTDYRLEDELSACFLLAKGGGERWKSTIPLVKGTCDLYPLFRGWERQWHWGRSRNAGLKRRT